jgi:hypothetical protein
MSVGRTELGVKALPPVLPCELSCDEGVAPVSCHQVQHLAEAGEVAARRQDDGGLHSFARQGVFAVTGPPREIREQPEYTIRGTWLWEVALDPPLKPGGDHGLIIVAMSCHLATRGRQRGKAPELAGA